MKNATVATALGAPWRRVLLAGDMALLLEFGDSMDPEVNEAVQGVAGALLAQRLPGVWSVVPGYRTLLVEYDPGLWERQDLLVAISLLATHGGGGGERRRHVIPVLYGGEWGPDLEEVAALVGRRPEDVVRLHAERDYRIFCLGFSPGYPFCGVLPEEIRLPRRATPRLKVPPGSVAIAGMQTGVYPLESAGGWHLIGRTPLTLFRWDSPRPTPFRPGDVIRFRATTEDGFQELRRRVLSGEDICESAPLEEESDGGDPRR